MRVAFRYNAVHRIDVVSLGGSAVCTAQEAVAKLAEVSVRTLARPRLTVVSYITLWVSLHLFIQRPMAGGGAYL